MARKRSKTSSNSFGGLGFEPGGQEEKALKRLLVSEDVSLRKLIRKLLVQWIKLNGHKL